MAGSNTQQGAPAVRYLILIAVHAHQAHQHVAAAQATPIALRVADAHHAALRCRNVLLALAAVPASLALQISTLSVHLHVSHVLLL